MYDILLIIYLIFRSWQSSKGRRDKAKEIRQKYLEKQSMNQQQVNKYNNKIIKDKLLKIEYQFKKNETNSIDDHILNIEKIQQSSFNNTQKYNNQDSEKRNELRTERIEWQTKLTEMDNVCNLFNEKLNQLKESMAAFAAKISKIDGKTKLKKCKGLTEITLNLPIDLIQKLTQQCQYIEKYVPKWIYTNKVNQCYEMLNDLIYDIMVENNNHFAQLIVHKKNIKEIHDEIFIKCNDKYINLCLEIFDQINIIKEWKDNILWSDKFNKEQNKSDKIIVESTFIFLTNLVPMTDKQNSSNIIDIEQIKLDKIKSYLNKIEFFGDSKDIIKVSDNYKIKLSVDYLTYVILIEQYLKRFI